VLEPNTARALARVAGWLDTAGVPYAVGGSALLALLGLDVTVADLDLQVPGSAREAVEAAPWPRLSPKHPDPRFPSDWLLRFKVGATAVEVIGEMRARIDGRVVEIPLDGGERVAVAGREVVLAPAGPWYHLYRMYRPERARALRDHMGDLAVADAYAWPDRAGDDGLVSGPPYDGKVPDPSRVEASNMTDAVDTTASEAAEAPVEIDLDTLKATLEYVRPALQADGGDLILLGVDEGRVNLQLVGACGGCPMATMTLTAGIERILKDRVPGVTEVHAV
jgi:Fe-S cluster biogenesis protein NfuA